MHTPIDKKLLCANLQPRCEVLGEIPEQLDFFDAMPDYDVSLYANKKQKTTPETAREALEALLPLLSDESLDFSDRDTVFNACKAKAEELARRTAGCSTRWHCPFRQAAHPRRRHDLAV